MMVKQAARSWLPASALAEPVSDRLISDVLRHWSRTWFARQTIRPLSPLSPSVGTIAADPAIDWIALGEELAIAVPKSSRLAFARAMLDAPDNWDVETGADRQLVDHIVQTCLDDLCKRLATAFEFPAETPWTRYTDGDLPVLPGRRECGLGKGAGIALLTIAVSDETVVQAIKGALPRKLSPPLAPISSALERQPIAISAALGTSIVTLADISALSEGDVIILPSEVGSAVPLAIDGSSQTALTCLIEKQDGAIILKLASHDRQIL